MKVKISRSGVTGVAYVADDLALSSKLSSHKTVGVALQVGVIENELSVGTELVDCGAAPFTLKQFEDLAISGGDDSGSGRRRNIDGVVDSSFRARICERIQELGRFYSDHWNDQFQSANKTGKVFVERLALRGRRRRLIDLRWWRFR